jgi:hypothetical protein
VTIAPGTDHPFRAVLIGHDASTLVHETWDDEAGLSVGEPRTVGIAEIDEVQVL